MMSAAFKGVGSKLFGFGLTLLLASSALVVIESSPSQAAVGDATPSAVSVRWDAGIPRDIGGVTPRDTRDPNYAAFRNMVFSVNQTNRLTNQGVSVSWSGAPVTGIPQFTTNFMQIMQCWKDDPRACQFGQPSSTLATKSGTDVQTRTITPATDTAQSYRMTPDLTLETDEDGNSVYAMPFVLRDGTSSFSTADYFSPSSTNEVGAATTGADGTGSINFEVQTALEAPHLGCGADDGYGTAQSCVLVIVPRGAKDLNGGAPSDPSGRIAGSPLSWSAWKNRVVIPLSFAPVSANCPAGQPQSILVGNELSAKAFESWQSSLCQNGTTFVYSRISDEESRRQITSTAFGASHLGVITDPVADTDPQAKGVNYAPLTQSAIVIAYNIDYSLYSDSPLFAAKNGTKVKNLRLSQRLVAKLLTQSYREDIPGLGLGVPAVAANPRAISTDPEFLALNPDFAGFTNVFPQGLFMPFGNADFIKQVWKWIQANPDAKAFLAGTPDPWGMVINPAYGALALDRSDPPQNFPKNDLTLYSDPTIVAPPYGTLDMRPYYNSLNESALRALRADGNVRTAWDPFRLPAPGAYVAQPPQSLGQRFILAITDLASAYRFGLDVAALQGSVPGEYVSPDDASISRAIANEVPTAIPGVTAIDWARQVSGAYPLAQVNYAAVSVCSATAEERALYSSFLDWATSTSGGQANGHDAGQLPYGYVPLTSAQREAAQRAIADLKSPADVSGRCPKAEPTVFPEQPVPVQEPVASAPSPRASAQPSRSAVPKLFIRRAAYGDTVLADELFTPARLLIAGGYLTGLPLALSGLVLMRRDRQRLRTAGNS